MGGEHPESLAHDLLSQANEVGTATEIDDLRGLQIIFAYIQCFVRREDSVNGKQFLCAIIAAGSCSRNEGKRRQVVRSCISRISRIRDC